MKFLIVDDDIVSRKKMEKILGSLGPCVVAEDGGQALAAFSTSLSASDPFDLVTLDIHMPGMDGTEVLDKMRQLEKNATGVDRAGILMVTANSNMDTVVNCIASACDDYVVKPFNREMILEKVRQISSRGSGGNGGVPSASEKPKPVQFGKGRIIFKEGEVPKTAYAIIDGSVAIFKVVNNQNVVLEHLHKGHMFGFSNLMTGKPRISSAMASEKCILQPISVEIIKSALSDSPVTIRRYTESVARRMRQVTNLAAKLPSYNLFLSICQVVNLIYLAHVKTPEKKPQRYQPKEEGINYSTMSRLIKSILPVSAHEIDITMKRLYNINLIDLTYRESGSGKHANKNAHTFVKILDQPKFINSAKRFYDEFKDVLESNMHRYEFLDLHDFAEYVDAPPEAIYKKIAAGEIPENIFYIHMNAASEWVREVGKNWFKKAKRRRVRIEDLEGVDDIILVDNATLQECLNTLGYYKIGLLSAIAGDDAREKIFRNLSSNVVNIIKEEMPSEDTVDELEASDIEEEFINLIKERKKKAGV